MVNEMKLHKNCTCCKKALTTKGINILGRQAERGRDMLYINCKRCKSTMVLVMRTPTCNITTL